MATRPQLAFNPFHKASDAHIGSMVMKRVEHTILEARTWAESGSLFAILDSCDMPSILQKVGELDEEHAVSLYRGTAEEQFADIAPYLVRVDTTTFDWIIESIWSEPWGVFVRSAAEFSALRTHFRKFLLVKSPEGEEWYFRFYDPRVLDKYLDTCTPEELTEFIGPVQQFAIKDEANYGVTALAR